MNKLSWGRTLGIVSLGNWDVFKMPVLEDHKLCRSSEHRGNDIDFLCGLFLGSAQTR